MQICDFWQGLETFGGNGRDSIETPFRDLIGDSITRMYHFRTGIVIMRHCDNLRPPAAKAWFGPGLAARSSRKHHFETAPMKINATLPEKGRDLRLDLFRGVANWAIYLDHIPDNVVNWITTRNYGFSDAADLFVFISGYTASFVYARMMLDRGFIVGATRLTKRVWQLYVAHIILFVIYIASISYLALRFGNSELVNEFNVVGLVDNATETLRQGLFLKFKPVNLDVLPLYIVLMGLFPPVLWIMLRQPNWTMVASIVLWLVSRQTGWNLPAYPGRNLVLQSVLLAGAVRVRLMVRARRRAQVDGDHQPPGHAVVLHRLSAAGTGHDDGRQVSGLRTHVPALALFDLQSERQDQSGALSLPALRGDRDHGDPLRTEGLAGLWSGRCSIP